MKRLLTFTLLAVLVTVALTVFVSIHHVDRRNDLSIERFVSEYDATEDTEVRRTIAERYLEVFSVAELNHAIEIQYPLSKCHPQGHGLGRAVYAREQNFSAALEQCAAGCNYGCFHGVLMEMFSTDSDTLGGAVNEENPDALMEHIRAKARELCASPEVQSVVLPVFCSHGVGHVFATVTDDLDRAVSSCGVFQYAIGRNTCSGGVFMEYGRQNKHRNEIAQKGLSMCDPYPEYRTQCYRYIAFVVVESLGGIRNAMNACRALGEERKYDCIFGMAYYEMGQDDFSYAGGPDAVCGSLQTAREMQSCIDGGLWDVVNRTADRTTSSSCDAMYPAYQERCRTFLREQQDTRAL